MKILKKFFPYRISLFRSLFFSLSCCLSILSSVSQSQAQLVTLNSGNSSLDVQVSGPGAGADNWMVDGVNNLYYQWFYYRVGPGPQLPINSIGAPVTNTPNPTRLDVTYGNGLYSVGVRYTLTGSSPGNSGLSETITLVNNSANFLDFHFYQYSDFDLNGIVNGQTVQYSTNVLGQYNKVVQSDGSRSVTELITSAAVPFSHVEAALYDQTFTNLTTGISTVLNDNLFAGPGDGTFAYQWDLNMAPGSTYIISKLITIVPEPSSFALVSVGMFGIALLRRRGRKA